MGVIQQSINQGISIAGFLYSQTDFAKEQGQYRKLTKEYERLEKATEIAEETPTEPEEKLKIAKDWESVARERYKLRPNEATYDALGWAGGSVYNAQTEIEDVAARAQEKAEEDAYYQRQADEDEAELARREQERQQSAAASKIIQSAIKDPRAIADEELQKAIEIKRETTKRKGGMML